MIRGNVCLKDNYTLAQITDQTFQQVITEWAVAHGTHEIEAETSMQYGAFGHYWIRIKGCVISDDEMISASQTFYLDDAQKYEGYLTEGTIYSRNTQLSKEDSVLAAFLLEVKESNKLAEEDFQKLLDMPVREFCEMFKSTAPAENLPGIFHARKIDVFQHPTKYRCPICGNYGLRVAEGVLGCTSCNATFGDYDELEEII